MVIICERCNQTFDRQSRLDTHNARATNNVCDDCPRIFCNRMLLERHRRTVHVAGEGILMEEHSQNEAICPDSGHSQTREYQELVDEHYGKIRSSTKDSGTKKVINKQLSPTYTYNDLKNLLFEVRNQEFNAFKINIGFGSILYDIVNKTYRYFYVSSNQLLFERAFTISTYSDMNDFYSKILSLDLANSYYLKRPSSSWVLAGLPNVEIRIFRLNGVPIGSGITLPDYIKDSKSIVGLTRDKSNGYDYEDNYCLFRCLAYHLKGTEIGLETQTKQLLAEFVEHTGKTYEEGVPVNSLAAIEIFFGININVYELQADKTAKVIRLSTLNYKNVMNLNVYENHFSYIKKFDSYARKYQCTICDRIVTQADNLKRHMKICNQERAEVYCGGKYRNKKNLFEHLEDIEINVPEELRGDPYVICYDFEALQVPIKDVILGRKIHYEHVPATVSICSNVPGYTDPIHLTSKGDAQELCDNFVDSLLTMQIAKERIMTERFDVYLKDLEERVKKLAEELGKNDESSNNNTRKRKSLEKSNNQKAKRSLLDDEASAGVSESKDSSDESRNNKPSRKRKRPKKLKNRKAKRAFLDDEASADDNESEDSDDSEESDIDDLINDERIDENDASFYARYNNEHLAAGPSTRPERPPQHRNEREIFLKEKQYKWIKSLLSKLRHYIEQTSVLGFNSQKYDIPLIKHYLPSSMIKAGCVIKNVIKKMGGYMNISSDKLNFLDMTNYLAAGTSLEKFYTAYNVSTPKGSFPYQWFDTLDKLDYTGLPPQTCFRSTLTRKNLDAYEYMKCWKAWKVQGMRTFGDYVRFYNDRDVIGFVEAVEKVIANERENKLDMFKESISLPGLTQRYLFKHLDKNDYFVGFGEEHKDLYKLLRDNIVGGPSIIFHRYHEKDVTRINGGDLCKKVIGYDANSLYLYCLAQEMPTGFYSLLEKKNNYVKDVRYSKESIQWLEHVMERDSVNIKHAENGGEERIKNYYVDGFDEENNTIYEYHGCFHHKHFCQNWYNEKTWNDTIEREEDLKSEGYNVVSITSCEWMKQPESKKCYSRERNPAVRTMNDILEDVKNDKIFGFVKCDLHTPNHLKEKFSEFPPIFKNCEITLADIGEHMQEYCRSVNRKTGVKKSLISSMYGEGILLSTPLLKKYLEMGLIVTNVETVIQYYGKRVFKWFQDEVCRDRRRADMGGEELKIKGEASKTKGNCGYGRTLMDKSKHTRICFAKKKNLLKHVNNPLLKSYDTLNEDVYEVEKLKKKVMLDLPIQIGVAVYNYAKLRLIEFWEFLNHYLINDLYQIMECDTDSLYIAFARESIDECVKADLLEEWYSEKYKWFSSEDKNSSVDFEGTYVPFNQFDKRTPGKFKPEFIGDGMTCLNSKVYHIWGLDKDGKLVHKTSCKGVQQKRNEVLKEHFLHVIKTQKPCRFENAGFIKNTHGTILTYTQEKQGLSYFYGKRKVLSDGVTTTHLDI